MVVIGGVTLSTLLTLVVVPCAYSLLSNLESTKHQKALEEALESLGEGMHRPSIANGHAGTTAPAL